MRSATYQLAANVLRQCGNSITMLVQYSPDSKFLINFWGNESILFCNAVLIPYHFQSIKWRTQPVPVVMKAIAQTPLLLVTHLMLLVNCKNWAQIAFTVVLCLMNKIL